MDIISKKAQFAVENLNIADASGVPDAVFESFQIAYLNNETRFGIDVKARQIAWSFTAALDAVIDGILNDDTPHIFVSINQDEAQEKIRYAKAIWESLDPDYRYPIIRSSQTTVEFSNGSRLISHPCKPVRGKARARIYLDEMAHYAMGLDRDIYLAALPSTVKGDGYIRIGSSPLGAKGLFWEIASEAMRKWPGYTRGMIPWWRVGALCKDKETAKIDIHMMSTEERVYEYGTLALIEIFENMFPEDFAQEYECEWVDEATAWISWEMIKRNQKVDLRWWHANSIDEAYNMLEDVALAVARREIEHVVVGGIDVGRKRDLTELMVLGCGAEGLLPLRFSVSLSKVLYDDQEKLFIEIIKRLPFSKVLVDPNGIGAQLAENLYLKTKIAEEFPFTNPAKELLAVEARLQCERLAVPIPVDRELAYQIHSIKKTKTASNLNKYDTTRNEKHHADKFWAWALGIYAAHSPGGGWGDIKKAALGKVKDYVEGKPWRN